MTEAGKVYLDRVIKHGFNHVDFTAESIKIRRELILPQLHKIGRKLPMKLRGILNLGRFATDLAEAAITVQGFAVNTLKVLPSKQLVVSDANVLKQSELFKKVEKPGIHWQPDFLEINKTISQLQNLVKRKNQIKGRTPAPNINIKIAQEKIYLPNEIKQELASLLLACLERYKQNQRKLKTQSQKEYKSVLFAWVVSVIDRYIQLGWLKYDEVRKEERNLSRLIAAFVLMAAGYLQTEEEYNQKPSVKDYRNGKDKPRHYTYHEILKKQLTLIEGKRKNKLSMRVYYWMFR